MAKWEMVSHGENSRGQRLMGTRQSRFLSSATICSRFAAWRTVWAVMRTIWQPAATRSSDCCTHASVSSVSQVIMDCFTTGESPPITNFGLKSKSTRLRRYTPLHPKVPKCYTPCYTPQWGVALGCSMLHPRPFPVGCSATPLGAVLHPMAGV